MIGDTIRKYRKANQMSQDDLAEKLNVTRQSISLWENGQTQPSLDSIVALAKLFNVSTDTLLTDDTPATDSFADELPFAEEAAAPQPKKFLLVPVLAGAAVVLAAVLFLVLKGCAPDKEPQEPNATKAATQTATATVTEADGTTTTTTATTTAKASATTTAKAEKQNGNGGNAAVTPVQPQNQAATKAPAKKTTKAPTKAATKPPAPKNFYSDLKAFVLKNGQSSGTACFFVRSSNVYGGSAAENFNATYWANNGDLSFCLYCPIDADHVLNIYIYVPQSGTSYSYVTSYCYQSGESITEAHGTIPAGEFTSNYPLPCSSYYGTEADRINFMEISRGGVCDLLSCVRNFLSSEGLGYTMSDIGFKSF